MKKRTLLFVMLASFSAGALAQLGGGMPGGGLGGGRANRGAGDRSGDAKRDAPLDKPRVNVLEVTLEEFHHDLKLRQEQEPAWQRYADSVRALAADVARQAAVRVPATAQPTLLQRIDRVVNAARNRLTALEE